MAQRNKGKFHAVPSPKEGGNQAVESKQINVSKTLRTRAEINQEYTQFALLLGDRVFKRDVLDAEIREFKVKMDQLNREPSLPEAPPAAPPPINTDQTTS